MYEIKEFQYLGHKLRVVIVDGETFYFAAVDVCIMLDIDTRSVSRVLFDVVPEDERIKLFELLRKTNDSILTLSKVQGNRSKWATIKPHTQLVTEAGLYRLVMRSNKPEAKKYQKWVFEDVLPTLHRTGTYTIPGFDKPQISEPAPQESKSHKVAHVHSENSCERYIKIGDAVLSITLTLPNSTTSEKFLSVNSVLSSSFDLLIAEIVKAVSRKY